MNKIKNLWFEKNRIYIETTNSDTYSRPLEVFPILKDATEKERLRYKIGKDKTDIRWKDLDEDIHIDSFFEVKEPYENNSVGQALKQFPQINI